MNMDEDAVIRAGQLNQYMYWLEAAWKKLARYKEELDAGWIGRDAYNVGLAVDAEIAELKKIYRELDNVRLDIIRAAKGQEWGNDGEA